MRTADTCVDDPAIVVGLAARFSRLGRRGDPIPGALLKRLRNLANQDVPSARLALWQIVKMDKAPYVALSRGGGQDQAASRHADMGHHGGER